MIEALERARLVVRDVSKDAAGREVTTVRVSHEALLTHWPRARQLFDAHAGMLDLRDRLNEDAQRWLAHGRDESYLLRGRLLAAAEELMAGERVRLSPEAVDYIGVLTQKAAAEQAREEAARAEAEQRQREREDEQARRLADAQALASANHRTAQRTTAGSSRRRCSPWQPAGSVSTP